MTETELIDAVNAMANEDPNFCEGLRRAIATKNWKQIRSLIDLVLVGANQPTNAKSIDRVVEWFAS